MVQRVAATRTRDVDLSVDEIVGAAIDLLDDGGIEAFSMRALAQELGRSTMAAYRHVPGREALLRLAAERVIEDVPDVGSRPWFERLETYTRHAWTTCWRAHPWIVDFIESGGVTERGAERLVVLEEVFREAGFAGDEVRDAVRAHWSFAVGTLRLIIATGRNAGRRDPAREDAIFEFNLRTWILGLDAMATGRQQGGSR